MKTLNIIVIGAALILFPSTADGATISATLLLNKLVVQKESGAAYARSAFPTWTDDDHDGCDTRKEVLKAESKVTPTIGKSCKIVKGKWKSWYDGKTWTDPADVDISHTVSLKEAWDSGAKKWSKATRTRYANDLGFAWSLDAVTDNINSSQGDRDPAEWLPPLQSAHCSFAIHWMAVKYRWKLSVDSTEKKTLLSLLGGKCGARTLTLPPQAI